MSVVIEADSYEEESKSIVSTQESEFCTSTVPAPKPDKIRVSKLSLDEFDANTSKSIKYQYYYNSEVCTFSDTLRVLKDGLQHIESKVNFDKVDVKIGRVKAKNTKWRGLRLELKGIGLIKIRTLMRNFFDETRVDERAVTTI